MAIEVTSDELLTIIGMKETEIIKLRVEVAQWQKIAADLQAQKETALGAEKETVPDGTAAHNH